MPVRRAQDVDEYMWAPDHDRLVDYLAAQPADVSQITALEMRFGSTGRVRWARAVCSALTLTALPNALASGAARIICITPECCLTPNGCYLLCCLRILV